MAEVSKVKPLADYLLIEPAEKETTLPSGIVLPDTSKEKPQEGEIVAVGNGKLLDDGKLSALTVKQGDRILFSKYSGTEVKLDGTEHLIMREDDILGIIEA